MSAYKEKELAEKRIRELKRDITNTEIKLWLLNAELSTEFENLETAIQDIRWEARNDR